MKRCPPFYVAIACIFFCCEVLNRPVIFSLPSEDSERFAWRNDSNPLARIMGLMISWLADDLALFCMACLWWRDLVHAPFKSPSPLRCYILAEDEDTDAWWLEVLLPHLNACRSPWLLWFRLCIFRSMKDRLPGILFMGLFSSWVEISWT